MSVFYRIFYKKHRYILRRVFHFFQHHILLINLLTLFVVSALCTSQQLLFYDQPEYVAIAQQSNLFQAMAMGHFPIKPFFSFVSWVHMLAGLSTVQGVQYFFNFLGVVCGLGTAFCVWKLIPGKLFQKTLGAIIFFFLPVLWVIRTAFFPESLALLCFVGAIYFAGRYFRRQLKRDFFVTVFLLVGMLGSHIQTVEWLPAYLGLSYFLFQQKNAKYFTFSQIKIVGYTVVFTILLYWMSVGFSHQFSLHAFMGTSFGKLRDVLGNLSSMHDVLRNAKNISLQVVRGYGAATALLVIFAGLKVWKKPRGRVFLILCFISMVVAGAGWTGDYMQKRLVFLAVPMVIVLVGALQKRALWVCISTVPMTVALLLLYLPWSTAPLSLLPKLQNNLPDDSLYLQTHYQRPFTDLSAVHYMWLGQTDPTTVEQAIAEAPRTFLDSQAIFAPYLLYTGSQLHVAGFDRFGVSESSWLFHDYAYTIGSVADARARVFTYELRGDPLSLEKQLGRVQDLADSSTGYLVGRAEPGAPVLVYSIRVSDRLLRQRPDYGDPFLWVYSILFRHQDPIGWTYAGKDGIFIYPVSSRLKPQEVYLEGEELRQVTWVDQFGSAVLH